MDLENICFFGEDRDVPDIAISTREWISNICDKHGYTINNINYIFCSDDYLLEINKEYLDHNYYTDIITFDNSDEQYQIESDIFISLDRVYDNANQLNVPRGTELLRVMAHGVLHLCGFKDKTEEDQTIMTKQENICLSDWFNNKAEE